MQQILDWMEEYNREGIMSVWLGPTYPLVLIYEPDLCEVRCSNAMREHFGKPAKIFFQGMCFLFQTLLNSSRHITKSPDYEFLHPWLGTGKYTSTSQAFNFY